MCVLPKREILCKRCVCVNGKKLCCDCACHLGGFVLFVGSGFVLGMGALPGVCLDGGGQSVIGRERERRARERERESNRERERRE